MDVKKLTGNKSKNQQLASYSKKLKKIIRELENEDSPNKKILREIYTELIWETIPENAFTNQDFRIVKRANDLVRQAMLQRIQNLESELHKYQNDLAFGDAEEFKKGLEYFREV